MINLEKIQKEKSIEDLLQFSIINIDKPANPTSFGVDTVVKKALNAKKTSHFGTLDPMVTGVLPVALNRACKLMGYFIGKEKTYVGILRTHEEISLKDLEKEVKNFIGEITQLPPVKSRVKRQERQRTIYTFKIIEQKGKDFLFETKVEAGTYIRKLIHDLGEKIGGAHMLELRRTQASIFNEKDSVNIYDFLEAVEEYKEGNDKKLRRMLIPGEVISKVLPVVKIDKKHLKKLYHGSPIENSWLKEVKEEKFALFQGNTFIGVYKKTNEKAFIARPEYVLQPIK